MVGEARPESHVAPYLYNLKMGFSNAKHSNDYFKSRTSILDLERAAAAHWRATEQEWLGGWLMRAAEGFTGRANSALPLGDPRMPLDEALAAVTGWYRARGLAPMIAVPMPLGERVAEVSDLDNQLAERSWPTRPGPAYVMTSSLAGAPPAPVLPEGAEFRVDDEPDDAWLAMYDYRRRNWRPPVMRTLLTSARAQAFASIRSAAGREVLAIGRLSIAEGWAGITAVEVNPARRRGGLGTALTRGVCAEAARRGVRRVFLQVETENPAAIAMYERCGFAYSHRYHYRVAP